jgi:Family of unknown function (DUF5691)
MSTWHDLVTASLIGTERSVVPAPAVPGLPPVAELAFAAAAAGERGDPAAVLLDRAALLTAARRAGRRPDRAEALPVCEPDPRPAVSPAAAIRLARMLSGEHPDLLTEWLTAAAARGLRPPPQSLPALLDRARRAGPADAVLRRRVAEAGGPRARWLAGLNPEWESVAAPAASTVAAAPRAEDAWRLGDTGQRRGYLASLLASDPDAARQLVAGSWGTAGTADRVMFLSVLNDRLGPADEPLLEGALDDRADDVRSWAAYLLARLPGSALGHRMAERALRCVRMEHSAQLAWASGHSVQLAWASGHGVQFAWASGHGPHLVVTPPAECDASMRHDGIAPGPAAGRGQLSYRAHLMSQVVARTPLRTWTDVFGLTAAQVVALPSGDWAPVLFTGWTRAAIAQHDHDWTAALISQALTGRPPTTATEMEALDLLARRADPALGAPDTLPEPGPDARTLIRAAHDLLRFRYDMTKELSDDGHDG